MQLTNGNLYWQKKSKIDKTYPYLTNNKTCDILVIGGGISGALSAYFLAKEGANVIVVEKNIIGYGSTSASSAMLEYQLDIDMCKLEKIIGQTQTKRIFSLCLEAIENIEKIDKLFEKNAGFARQDAIYFSNKFMQKGAMTKEFETRKKAGFNTSFLNTHDTLALNSGILTKNASGIINPYAFTQGLFEYLSKMSNVSIYENTKIEDVKCGYENVVCKTNNNFKIKSDNVIFSSGFETLRYLPDSQVDIYKTFTIVSKQIDLLKNINTDFTAKDMSEPSHCIRFTKGNRIIYGGENIKYSEKLLNKKYLLNVANDKYKKLFSFMQKTLYNIEDIPIEYAFNTTFASTKDTLPIIDELPGMPNCFCNLGFGTNGILYSTIGASMLKDAIKGLYTKDINMFKANR
ncbi:MAG: FAD-binding oxidoreductase [Clostridia bacterium]